MKKIAVIFVLFLLPLLVSAANKNIVAYGEAPIVGNDVGAAKYQALARAKWVALEEAAGVKVKVETIVQNATLVDEAIKTEVKGFVENYKILDEGKKNDIYWVKISASISPSEAEKVVSLFAKNTSIALYLPVIFTNNKVEETTPLSEKIINELASQGFEVVDIASLGDTYTLNQIDYALKNNNFTVFRNLSYKFLTGAILIGKVETTLSAPEGKNIGYGISMPFNIVTGRLTYRLIGDKNGQKIVVASGYISGKGQGPTPEDATYNMLENLVSNVSNELISVISEKIKGQNKKTIEIVLAGNNDLNKILELKNDLQYISWVLNAEDKGVDKVVVEYPEKTIYLASAIKNIGKYEIKKFDNYRIVLRAVR